MRSLEQGVEIHQRVIERGFLSDVVVINSLIDMYVKSGSIQKARELFDKMPKRDPVSWTVIIAGCVRYGFLDDALKIFKEMPQRDVISWTAVLAGYAQNGLAEKALKIFKEMLFERLKPDSATFASVLPACAQIGALKEGMEIHRIIIESGFLSDAIVVTALIVMYMNCGRIQKARALFDKMPKQDAISWNAIVAGYAHNGGLGEALRLFREIPQRNVVSWTAMITGYAKNGFIEKSLEFFKQMQLDGVKPNSATFANVLSACATMIALQQGMEIHQRVIECGFLSDVMVVIALIDMYAKCASIKKAHKLFEKVHRPTVVLWTAMIAGYANHGHGKDALELFELMKHSGTNPNHVSFVCVLFACSHAGLVDEGCKYFNCMNDSYSIMPTIDHYTCMVDLLRRAGYLEETLNFIIKMPIKPDAVVWMCLLGVCRSHENIELGEFAATLIFELDPRMPTPYVLLLHIYADAGRWDDVQRVWKLMKDKGAKKIPGCSWI
ncbi:pentatricopeptide repeat-containing protein At2g13600 [Cryptomeria japonica]|uniref:pentatricopeptide repeat-containing protein At2g13600 n=1 Tax=Cryptomeria japonica TaxID=3369 RepID=UPI0027DA5B84|nr:pentatricopeptide repeat-containing protein At2g13600 [Cryptomeria japonica]